MDHVNIDADSLPRFLKFWCPISILLLQTPKKFKTCTWQALINDVETSKKPKNNSIDVIIFKPGV